MVMMVEVGVLVLVTQNCKSDVVAVANKRNASRRVAAVEGGIYRWVGLGRKATGVSFIQKRQ